MQNKPKKFFLSILLLILLVSCNQEEIPPSPASTPTLSIEYPISFLRGYWELIEYTVGEEVVDIVPIRPVYLNFSVKYGNSWLIGLIYKCYIDSEESTGDSYMMNFISSNHFETKPGGDGNDVQCEPELEPYMQKVGRAYYTDHYSMEGETLLLHGTDPETGDDMVMAWERTKSISYHE